MVAFSDEDNTVFSKAQRAALAYLVENEKNLKSALCKNGSVKAEVIAAGGTAGIVTDYIAPAIGLFPSIGSLSNLLCVLGLSKFCEGGSPQPEIIKIQ